MTAMSEKFVLGTELVRAFVEDVQSTIAAASSPEQACDALRPRFAELLADPDWLPVEYQAAAPESGRCRQAQRRVKEPKGCSFGGPRDFVSDCHTRLLRRERGTGSPCQGGVRGRN